MSDLAITDCAALGLYMDGELDVIASLAFEAHAAACESCKRDLAELGALRERLRRDLARHPAGDRLRSRLAAALAETADAPDPQPAAPSKRPAARRRWLPLAAAAAMISVLSSGATLYLGRPGAEAPWIDGVVAAHERAMLSGHAFDVASSDRHVVKPWFSGRTTVAPPVVDLGQAGFPLLGGRLDVPQREPTPTLVYRTGRHVVSLFMRPAEGEAPPRLEKIDGFSLLRWKQQGFAFYAVSDVDSHELEAFQKAFAAGLDPVR